MAVVTLLVGLVVGFILGWLVRDEMSRPLLRDDIGLGVPEDWVEWDPVRALP